MKKKIFVALLAVVCIFTFAIPVLAAPSYDSTVKVSITPDDAGIVLYDDSVDVTFTINVENISKSGDLPQIVVTPLGDNTNGLVASPVTKIVNKKTGVFEFTVTYTEVGTYEFWVNIRNMQGNSGKWNYEFTTEKVTVTIVAPPEEENMPEGFTVGNNGLVIDKNVLAAYIGNFEAQGQNTTITVKLNGSELKSGQGFNTNNNAITIKKFEVGTYVITNTVNGVSKSLTFKVSLVDGNNSIIEIVG